MNLKVEVRVLFFLFLKIAFHIFIVFHCISHFNANPVQEKVYKKVFALISIAICTLLIINKATPKDESYFVATLSQRRLERHPAIIGYEVLGKT